MLILNLSLIHILDDYKELLLDAEIMFLATVLNCTKNIYTSKEKEIVI